MITQNIQRALLATLVSIVFTSGTQLSAQHACAKHKIEQHAILFAQEKMPSAMDDYDIHYHKLELEVSNTSTYLRNGKVTTRATCVVPLLTTYQVELSNNLTVSALTINGNAMNFTHSGDTITVGLTFPILENEVFEVIVDYEGLPPNSGSFFGGIFQDQSPSWGVNAMWTLSEPYAAHYWWPCKQDLYDKIDSMDIWLTVEEPNKAGSNGVLTQINDLGNGKKRYEWSTRYPMVYYLVSMAVAPYQEYNITANPVGLPPVFIQNYVYDVPNLLNTFQDDIDETVDMLEYFSTVYGPYPFAAEKYGHCMAPLSGGMEHQTMTTQGYFVRDLTAHELGHQWFGDNVTCGTWEDIWLNEGFATYSEYLFQEHMSPGTGLNMMQQTHNSVKSQNGGSVFVDDVTSPNRIFSSRLTYNKGCALVHMIRHWINDDELFFDILQTYQTEKAFDVAITQELEDLLERESGIVFDDFFNDWFRGEGFPLFDITWSQQDSVFAINFQQTPSTANGPAFFHTPLEVELTFAGGSTRTLRHRIDEGDQSFGWLINEDVINVQIDPALWVLKDVQSVSNDNSLVFDGEVIDPDAPVDTVSSLANAENLGLALYPNPGQGMLSFEGWKEGDQITAFDSKGSKVGCKPIGNGRFELQGSPGVYLITIQRGDGYQEFTYTLQ